MKQDFAECLACDGRGWRYEDAANDDGNVDYFKMTCLSCDGDGVRDLRQEAEDFEADCRYDMEKER